MSVELKRDRCPFCGHGETRFARISESEIYVACNRCHSCGPMDITERLATKGWSRAPRPVVHRLVVESPDMAERSRREAQP